MKKTIPYLLILYMLGTGVASGQKRARIDWGDSDLNTSISYSDTLQLISEIKNLLKDQYNKGFLTADVSKIHMLNDSTLYVRMNYGPQFKWAELRSGNVPEELLTKIGFRHKFYLQKPFYPKELSSLYSRILKESENSGYPFAAVSLDSIHIQDNTITGNIFFQKGPYITFDSLEIISNVDVNHKWLQAYLSILPGQPFNQSKIDQIEEKLERLQFIELEQLPRITFQNEQATIILSVKKAKANTIDGIIGFFPNEKADGSLLLTGQFDMKLANLFNSGKKLAVEWQSLKPQSQLLVINYHHTNLFYSPLGISSSFYLLKEDTTFINRKGRIALNYPMKNAELSLFTSLESSRKLNSGNETFAETQLSDFNITYYGVGYSYISVTRSSVPLGWVVSGEFAIGQKKIRNANTLPAELLNEISLNSTQYSSQFSVRRLQPVSKSLGIMIGVQSGWLVNDNLFLNDLYRIGGLTTLRGFNQNFFFASKYAIGTIEWRIHSSRQSYLYLFYDQSALAYSVNNQDFNDNPYGVGLGMQLKTTSGYLNIAYALGASSTQPLNVRLSKFHFGYVANF